MSTIFFLFCFAAPWLPYAENVSAFVNHLFIVIKAVNSLGFEVSDCKALESKKKAVDFGGLFRDLPAKASNHFLTSAALVVMYQCLSLHDFKTGIFVSSKGTDGYILSRQFATVWLHEMIFFFTANCL